MCLKRVWWSLVRVWCVSGGVWCVSFACLLVSGSNLVASGACLVMAGGVWCVWCVSGPLLIAACCGAAPAAVSAACCWRLVFSKHACWPRATLHVHVPLKFWGRGGAAEVYSILLRALRTPRKNFFACAGVGREAEPAAVSAACCWRLFVFPSTLSGPGPP